MKFDKALQENPLFKEYQDIIGKLHKCIIQSEDGLLYVTKAKDQYPYDFLLWFFSNDDLNSIEQMTECDGFLECGKISMEQMKKTLKDLVVNPNCLVRIFKKDKFLAGEIFQNIFTNIGGIEPLAEALHKKLDKQQMIDTYLAWRDSSHQED